VITRQGEEKANMITSFAWEIRRHAPSPFAIRWASAIRSRSADTLYEAAVLALKSFPEHDCAPGPAAHLSIEVKSPSVSHTLVAHAVEDWLNGGAKSPKEAIEKRRLKELLGS
jgi:hypothetical protein